MKRIVSIVFLSVALLVLTTLSLVPHHHHRAVMCTVVELCEADHAYNDRHTEHDTTDDQSGEEGCVAHVSFAPANMQVGVTTPDALLLQAVGQIVLSSVPEPAAISRQAKYGLFILALKFDSPNSGSGLRAPPTLS